MKYKAQGTNGCTFGLQTDDKCYMQIKYPNNEFGTVQEIEEGGQFGWKWWMSKHEPEEIESFPEQCDLTNKL
jgi:hypothetical protein